SRELPVFIDCENEIKVVIQRRILAPGKPTLPFTGFVAARVKARRAVKVDVVWDAISGYDYSWADLPVCWSANCGANQPYPSFNFLCRDEVAPKHHHRIAHPKSRITHVSAGHVDVIGGGVMILPDLFPGTQPG